MFIDNDNSIGEHDVHATSTLCPYYRVQQALLHPPISNATLLHVRKRWYGLHNIRTYLVDIRSRRSYHVGTSFYILPSHHVVHCLDTSADSDVWIGGYLFHFDFHFHALAIKTNYSCNAQISADSDDWISGYSIGLISQTAVLLVQYW